MHKLAPTSLYRLQTLAQTGARFYQVSVYMRRLEVLGLIEATGRADPEKDSAEYRITDSGRAELEERYGPSSTTPIESGRS
jgi:DNA-binding PadR family transcriptional regulator